jgi:spermidine/putrescine transport system permease protein
MTRLSASSWLLRALVYGVPLLLILAPLLAFLSTSLWSVTGGEMAPDLSFANYGELLRGRIYLPLLGTSLLLAIGVAAIGLVLGYVVAYLVWRLSGRLRYILLLLTIIPLSMNYVVKIYAMRGILGYNGYLNNLLLWAGVIDEPSRLLLFNRTAVLITMAVIYLPYAIFPIFLSLERISPAIVAASADLGARPGRAFRTVVLPLSVPGAVVAALFVMVLALGDFLTPQMVGGNRGFTFGSVIWSQFGLAFNWPFGAALATVLLAVVLLLMAMAQRVAARIRVR